ncbi:MAG: PAS domain S-box protein [Nostocaceae cyanobacterium]|nr:PAS domain S-box protein [Nostocaceae cyanobacterium]
MPVLPQFIALPSLESTIDVSPLTVAPETLLFDAIALMAKQSKGEVNAVLVVEDLQVVGCLTEQDVVRLVARGVDLRTTKISAVMNTPVVTCQRSELEDRAGVIALFREHCLRLLPIVDEQGQLVGVITPESICQALEFDLFTWVGGSTEEKCQIGFDKGAKALGEINFQLVDDIADRTLIEEQLRQSQQMLQLILDHIPQSAFWKDRNSVYLGCNRKFALDANVGLPENIIGKTDYDFPWTREEADWYRQCDRQVMESNQVELHIIETQQHADGKQIWLDTNKIPLHDAKGNVVGILGTYEDITSRKEAEAKLKQTQERLQAILDNSPAVIYVLDTQLRYQLINRQFEKLFHITQEQILGKSIYDIWSGEIAEGFAVSLHKVLAEGVPLEFENVAPHEDGLHTYISFKFPLKDANGVPFAICGISTDISERKKAEDSLLHFRTAIESSSDAIAICELTGNVVYINPAFTELFEYSWEELQKAGGGGVLFQHGKEFQKILATVQTGKSWRGEVIMETITQMSLEIYLRVDPIRDATDKIVGLVGIYTDITERKRAEESLRLRDRAIAASSNGILISDIRMPSQPVTYVNPAFEAMTGYCAAEIIGKNIRFLQGDDSNQQSLIKLHSAIAQAKSCTVVLRNYRKDGTLFWNELSVSPVYDPDGKYTHYISIQTDITERKQLEEDLRLALSKEKELNELKSRFVAMTSHEFRTPLSTIFSSAELLEYYGRKWTVEKQLTHLHRIQNAVQQMTELLDDILLIGRAEAGKLEYKPVPLDLVAYCRSLVEELQLNVKNQQVIAFSCDYQFISCCMDEKLLGHILNNLLANAIKYSPHHSTINFTLTCQEKQALFEIQDQGIGIPPEDLPHLFESFHRATNVTNIQGTGLGLAIVKKCVDIHKGEIAVKTELGLGTTFIVTLPLGNGT